MEDKEYVLVLKGVQPDKKIDLLEKIRKLTNLDLKFAKDLIETPDSCIISSVKVGYDRLGVIKKDLEDCGAIIEIRDKNSYDKMLLAEQQKAEQNKQNLNNKPEKNLFLQNFLIYIIFIAILFAFVWCSKAHAGDTAFTAKNYYSMGNVYLKQEKYREAVDSYYNAKKLFESIGDKENAKKAEEAYEMAGEMRCEFGDYCQ